VDFKEIPINAIHCDPTGTHCEVDEMEVRRPGGREGGREGRVGGVLSPRVCV
jgi:hypothetical protein